MSRSRTFSLVRWLDQSGRRPALRWVAIVHDLVAAAVSIFAAYVTVLDLEHTLALPGLWEKVLGFVAISAVFNAAFAVSRGSWRYVSIPDVLVIGKSSVVTVLIYTMAVFLTTRGENVPRSVLILSGLYLVFLLLASRLSYRLLLEYCGNLGAQRGKERSNRQRRHVLLLGLTNEAESFIRATRRDAGRNVSVCGILDDARANHARMIQGVAVLGSLGELGSVVKQLRRSDIFVSEIIVAEKSPSRDRLTEVVEAATDLGIKATRIADVTNTAAITNGRLIDPKPIEIGDLLGRAEIRTDLEGVARLVNDKVILATGAGGSIGSELCRQIASFMPRQLVITDSSEFLLYKVDTELRDRHPGLQIITRLADVRDKTRISTLLHEIRPDVVFHAAALKHVPLVENNPLEGIKTNLLGTCNVADAAVAEGCSTFVMISTDKAVNPTNVMGATKRAAEAYCQAQDVTSTTTRFKTVRFGNVLGSNGSVVPRFQEQIANGGPVTVTHPQVVRYFMTIPEAVSLVLHASGHEPQGERGKIIVLDMGDPVRISSLAERMIQLAGFRPNVDIKIVYTGLRPGEKLYEELFDQSEVRDESTLDGYFVASPRIIDRNLLGRTISEIEIAVDKGDSKRAIDLLRHIVPEYKPAAPVIPIFTDKQVTT